MATNSPFYESEKSMQTTNIFYDKKNASLSLGIKTARRGGSNKTITKFYNAADLQAQLSAKLETEISGDDLLRIAVYQTLQKGEHQPFSGAFPTIACKMRILFEVNTNHFNVFAHIFGVVTLFGIFLYCFAVGVASLFLVISALLSPLGHSREGGNKGSFNAMFIFLILSNKKTNNYDTLLKVQSTVGVQFFSPKPKPYNHQNLSHQHLLHFLIIVWQNESYAL